CLCARFAVCSFFFHDTAPTEIYTLSLHDALPICEFFDGPPPANEAKALGMETAAAFAKLGQELAALRQQAREYPFLTALDGPIRSEEHTSELQSRENLVCRLLLEKKKKKKRTEYA